MDDVADLLEELLEHLDALGHHAERTVDATGSPALAVASSSGTHVVVALTAAGELVDEDGRRLRLPGFVT